MNPSKKAGFICEQCGTQVPKWMGRCPGCGAWDSMKVHRVQSAVQLSEDDEGVPEILSLGEVSPVERWPSGISEWDRVVGGGLVPGGVYLIGGEPGIGKSTLMLQVAERMLATNHSVLYVAGEESASQIRRRAERLNLNLERLAILSQAELHKIIGALRTRTPGVVIVDSIQTMYSRRHPAPPGTPSQLRITALRLIQEIKKCNSTLLLIGHVTKTGLLAGPRLLEHMVDAVFYFEGDRHHAYRMLRAVKNRFSSADEVGIFEMTERGMVEVPNPAVVWLEMEHEQARTGGILCSVMEGSRTMVLEIQALVAPTVYAAGRRTALGVDLGRVHMLAAVVERTLGFPLSRYDIYVRLSEGFRSRDPGLDLPLVTALISSFENFPIPMSWGAFGEVALTGRVRPVTFMQRRWNELQRQGVSTLFTPRGKLDISDQKGRVEVLDVRSLRDEMKAGYL